jgi:hypothetical protein
VRRRHTRVVAGLLAGAGLLAVGCGSSPPREASIYHDPALRPTVVAADDPAAEALLASVSQAPTGEAVGPYVLGQTYFAASGRRCRPIRSSGGRRLVCENDDGSWSFVPQLFGAPFEERP